MRLRLLCTGNSPLLVDSILVLTVLQKFAIASVLEDIQVPHCSRKRRDIDDWISGSMPIASIKASYESNSLNHILADVVILHLPETSGVVPLMYETRRDTTP